MPRIPHDKSFDSTLALLRDPYEFIRKRSHRYGSDLFQTRLLLHPTICMTGPAAAELFYDQERFTRRGAAPARMQKTLLGEGGVQGLDGEAHQHRKQMFLSVMTPEHLDQLLALAAHWSNTYARRWAEMDQVALYGDMREILTRAVCAWSGTPLEDAEVALRTRELTALFAGAGAVGWQHWEARLARKRSERWAGRIIEEIRAGTLIPPKESAVSVIAWHRDFNGDLLSSRVGAVELLNVLRPTVAVAVYIVFVAHALHTFPACRELLQSDEDEYVEWFVQEVRRFYPFFPAVVARTRCDFEWQGYRFPQGRRVMLDLYGTNHDVRAWDAPEEFRPERFRQWDRDPFTFIPQVGGDHWVHHRCPGEWIAIKLMKMAAQFLTSRITYDVPDQDLHIDRSRLPALPRSQFIMSNVRTVA